MNIFINIPLFSIVLCLICSVVSSVLSGRWARKLTIALTAALSIGSAAVLGYNISTGQAVTFMMGHFPAPWGNEIRFGVLEPMFCMIFSLVMLLSVLGGKKHLELDLVQKKSNLYYVMTDLVMVSLLALCYTNDIFTGYVFIEICTISSCGILMIRQIGRTTLASIRYMIFSLLGSGLFLFGIIILYDITGHLLMPNVKAAVAEIWKTGEYRFPMLVVMCLISIGLSIKSGLFPFHFWMPDTYGYSTPCSSALLSGIISKGYIFLLIKFIFDVFGTDVFYSSGVHNVLYLFGLCGIVVGSLCAIRENNISRMTAYSSAAQIGYIYMGIGISPTFGILAALFHIMSHAIAKPALFLSASALSDASGGSRQFTRLHGAGHRNRAAGIMFTVGAFSMTGIPGTCGFISKYLFASAGFHASMKMLPTLIVLAVSTILNAVYFIRTVVRIYSPAGADIDGTIVKAGQQKSFVVSAAMFTLANLVVGLCSQPVISLIEKGMTIL